MLSKRRYYICICSVILGDLSLFEITRLQSVILPKILDAIQRITKVKNVLIPLSITFFESENFRFPFSYEK